MVSLDDIVKAVRNYPGVARKKYAGYFSKLVKAEFYGEDAAYIKFGDNYVILATDSIWHKVIEADLYWAGFVSILVNVHDVYAMGGKPLAALNVVSARSKEEMEEIARGIRDACEKFDVKIVGGHIHPDAKLPSIDVSMIGVAKSILRSDTAETGDKIVFAADLEGKPHPKLPYNFDSTNKSKEVLKYQFESMVEIAERKLANAAKDVSNAGILGTIAMMMEVSGKGCEIFVDRIFKPKNVSFVQWLLSYPACAFVVTTKKEREVLEVFEKHNLAAEVIGIVTDDKKVLLKSGREEAVLFDLNSESVLEIKE
ncbi:methanogenesis marker protein 2 [Ferroglobus placidus DSM 10642]|uniref:Methanogenesis marker protein 2 n=1 Tax=Ferroglobus placidus (strain DSM 10642 / AEDII12DO) TaxID=589924 RepID=D3S114_FERPA|nr:AIR synthase related protein [Ferroglobus placidus]ADC64250.1 methanogenesis marker protein 2 [Ferroglobus placidus DSM 10642]